MTSVVLGSLTSITTGTTNYLTNDQTVPHYTTIPYDNAGFHNQWPYTGAGCVASEPNSPYVYIFSSQGLYYYGNTHNKCYRNRRELTVIKYDIDNDLIASRLYLESHNTGLGSDDIRTCGITTTGLLYGCGGELYRVSVELQY